MTQGEKAIALWLASVIGIILLTLGGILWFPSLMREKARIQAVRDELMDQRTLDAEAQAFFEDVQARVTRLASATADKEEMVAQAAFPLLPEGDIPAFIEELQIIFSAPGLRLLNLAYQPRTTLEGFITLPFEVRLETPYPALRQLFHTLESHTGRLRIDRLEFQKFDNLRHQIEIKLNCSARFARNG